MIMISTLWTKQIPDAQQAPTTQFFLKIDETYQLLIDDTYKFVIQQGNGNGYQVIWTQITGQ